MELGVKVAGSCGEVLRGVGWCGVVWGRVGSCRVVRDGVERSGAGWGVVERDGWGRVEWVVSSVVG